MKNRWNRAMPVAGCCIGAMALAAPLAARQAPPPATKSVAFALDTQIPFSASSAEVAPNGEAAPLVRMGTARFRFDARERLTATAVATITTSEAAEYDVRITLADAAGKPVGAATARLSVPRIQLGRPLTGDRTLTFDFGAAPELRRAATFTVGIARRGGESRPGDATPQRGK